MFCKNCGAELQPDVEVCTNCGKSPIEEKAPKNKKKLVIAIIAIVLVIAIVAGTVIIISSKKDDGEEETTTASVKTEEVAAKQDFEITEAEYMYYYFAVYDEMLHYFAKSYNTRGYDTSKPPHEQTSMTEDEDGNPISWVEYLRQKALDTAKAQHIAYNQAVAEGQATLSAKDKKQIDECMEEWKVAAEEEGLDLNGYLADVYGDYMDEDIFCQIIEKESIVANFYKYKYEEIEKSYTQEEINSVYNKDKSQYDLVSLRIYEAGNRDEARSFISTVTDEKSFIEETAKRNKDNPDFDADVSSKIAGVLKSEAENISEDCADWLFSTTTKVGDMSIFKAKNGPQYYVIMLTKAPHQVNTVSVRHILFATTDSTTGEPVSDAEIIDKKRAAEDALKKWQEGDKTAESFGVLAAELTEDTGSIPNGGLYENIRPGQMVHEFDEWIFDKNRKPGDTAIIETDYGYHVMYFEKNDGMYYDATIRESMASEKTDKFFEELIAENGDKINLPEDAFESCEAAMNEHIAADLNQYTYY